MTLLAHHPLPVVQTYETEDEFVLEIELPPGEPHVTAELNGQIIRLRMTRPSRHPAWEANPDASSS